MAQFSITEHFLALPETVFKLASDFHHAAENIAGIESLEVLTDGPIGVGTRFRETRIMFGKASTEEMEITAFDPPQGYTVEGDSCGCHFCFEYKFVGDSSGTELRIGVETTPLTFMAKLMSPLSKLMTGPMKKCIAADLDCIRKLAEANGEN